MPVLSPTEARVLPPGESCDTSYVVEVAEDADRVDSISNADTIPEGGTKHFIAISDDDTKGDTIEDDNCNVVEVEDSSLTKEEEPPQHLAEDVRNIC